MYAQDSIDLLSNCGIQFEKHDELGIEVNEFAELLMTSGVVLSDSVHWITFHRLGGFPGFQAVTDDSGFPVSVIWVGGSQTVIDGRRFL